jgi:hypothetical protein
MARAMALNVADWHTVSLRPYGVRCFQNDSLWWREPGGSGIYLGAIILDAKSPDDEILAGLEAVKTLWGTGDFALYDCYATRDLAGIGFDLVIKNPWHLRPPSPIPAPKLPDGLTIEIVRSSQELAEFEWASWAGFEEPENPEEAFRGREAFSQHAEATLDDAGMYYLNARLEGQVVAGVILYATEDMLGIYGISTLKSFRRRGYAAALIRAAMALRPELPACVFPEPVSVPIYTDIGFVAAGEIAVWERRKES